MIIASFISNLPLLSIDSTSDNPDSIAEGLACQVDRSFFVMGTTGKIGEAVGPDSQFRNELIGRCYP